MKACDWSIFYNEELANSKSPGGVAEAGPLRLRPLGRSDGLHEVLHRDHGVERGDGLEVKQGVPGQEADSAPARRIGDPGREHQGPYDNNHDLMTR